MTTRAHAQMIEETVRNYLMPKQEEKGKRGTGGNMFKKAHLNYDIKKHDGDEPEYVFQEYPKVVWVNNKEIVVHSRDQEDAL